MYFEFKFYALLCTSFLVLVVHFPSYGHGLVTKEEQKAFLKFKETVELDLLYQDYMQINKYLIEWSKVNNMDIKDTYKMLKQVAQSGLTNITNHPIMEQNFILNCNNLLPSNLNGQTLSIFQSKVGLELRKPDLGPQLKDYSLCLISTLQSVITTTIKSEDKKEPPKPHSVPQNVATYGILASVLPFVNTTQDSFLVAALKHVLFMVANLIFYLGTRYLMSCYMCYK